LHYFAQFFLGQKGFCFLLYKRICKHVDQNLHHLLIAKIDPAAIFRLSKSYVVLVLHWALEVTTLPNFTSILYWLKLPFQSILQFFFIQSH